MSWAQRPLASKSSLGAHSLLTLHILDAGFLRSLAPQVDFHAFC
eukprot:CAMPEP_0171069758 /NCGR_PEP_ID=MMETSP0766_2-20121228/9345_1 /TAXON_ID=439317 /ORGANISM="Gambierdiscus australes, Strain CAWD 149" /LENGTH=43 /DNA_ID= /DNA_START= /DNA_END= /DNA_ORIENTATION=